MSKQPPQEDPPPAYTEAPSSSSSSTTVHPSYLSPSASDYTTHLTTHLSALPSRLRASQTAHTTTRAAHDLDLITQLVPEVESFLSDLSTRSPTPSIAELTLVPSTAVPDAWALAGAAERRREGEVVQLVRVADLAMSDGDSKTTGDSKGGADRKTAGAEPERDYTVPQFDSWGRWIDNPESTSSTAGGSWWGDEAMARRLAGILQPKAEVNVERREVATAVQTAREDRKGWGWGARKQSSSTTVPTVAVVTSQREGKGVEERVSMTVRAEEVTFRKENAFGVWESKTGWGVVVRVRIRRP